MATAAPAPPQLPPPLPSTLPVSTNKIVAQAARMFAEAMAHYLPAIEQLRQQVEENERMLAQQRALLMHNHNVNTYLTYTLENMRDLDQSMNEKLAELIFFQPHEWPSNGTDLREAIPADPRHMPQLSTEPSKDRKVRAKRAAEADALIAQMGRSATAALPLCYGDFPRNPAIAPPDYSGGDMWKAMEYASIPPYGAPRPPPAEPVVPEVPCTGPRRAAAQAASACPPKPPTKDTEVLAREREQALAEEREQGCRRQLADAQ